MQTDLDIGIKRDDERCFDKLLAMRQPKIQRAIFARKLQVETVTAFARGDDLKIFGQIKLAPAKISAWSLSDYDRLIVEVGTPDRAGEIGGLPGIGRKI